MSCSIVQLTLASTAANFPVETLGKWLVLNQYPLIRSQFSCQSLVNGKILLTFQPCLLFLLKWHCVADRPASCKQAL